MPNIAKHKQNLIVCAMRLFRRQGYASTGLNQILEESGAPKGSLYHYFPGGKEELGLAAIRHAGELISEMLREIAADSTTPEEFVESYCRTMAGWMKESGFQSGCPVATTLLETVPHSPQLTQAGNAVFDEWIGIISRVFDRDSPAADARSQAEQLVSLMEGALLLSRVRQSEHPIRQISTYWDWNAA